MASLLVGGAVAGGVAAASAISAGTIVSTVLAGLATVAGVVATISASEQEAERQEIDAIDAEREQELETLQGIERQVSIKKQLVDAIGQQDVAYAASGVDLSFGTAAQARSDAMREGDTALTGNAGTQLVRQSRLAERAANYRTAAKQTRRIGVIRGISQGLSGFAGMIG